MAGDADNKRCRKWNDCELFYLINIWKNFTLEFDDYKRNSPIYHRISAEFSKCYSDRSVQDVRTKIRNLMLEYKREKLNKKNGLSSSWKFFTAVDEVIANMPKKAVPLMLYAPDYIKSVQKQELSNSVMQEMELDDARKIKNYTEEDATQLLKSLIISHSEYIKTAKGTDDKLLEIVRNLKHLQKVSLEIGEKVHEQLQLILQKFEKKEIESNASISVKDEPKESIVTEPSESIALLSLHDQNEVTQTPEDFTAKPVAGEIKNSIMEDLITERKACKHHSSTENPLLFDAIDSPSKNGKIKVKPKDNMKHEIHKGVDDIPGVSYLNDMSPENICCCHSPASYYETLNDDQVQNQKKHLELESSESDDDDDIYFLKSVLPDLRRLPRAKKAYVKLKIQEIIFSQVYGNI